MNYHIIPTPFKLLEQEGCFRLRYDTVIVLTEDFSVKDYHFATLLSETIEESTGLPIRIVKGQPTGANEIVLEMLQDPDEMPEAVSELMGLKKTVGELKVPSPSVEKEWKIKMDSYNLTVTEKSVVISAKYSRGLLYGVSTLRQLISQLGMIIPCMEIEDRPAVANRGFYHDATRGRIQKLEYYKKLADKCAYYKLNQLQLYVEHSYMFRDFSEVWRDDNPLTAEDILELDSYCKSLCIELIPSLASFGHLDKVFKTKSFTELCELPDSDKDRFSFRGRMEHHTINMTDPGAFDFIKKMLDEFIPLFTSKQFNLCGDETFDLGKGRSKALADEIGVHRIYVDFVKKICHYLREKGLRPMFWGDIIVGSPELMRELPGETVCLTWGYSEEESDRSARIMNEVGATQYLCPGVHGWRHFINKSHSAYANISRMCGYAKKYRALGVLNTDWGDYGHVSDPSFSIPGLIYGAEGSWSSEMPMEAELNRRISLVEYGDSTGKIVDIISDLGSQEAATWDNIVNIYEFSRGKSVRELKQGEPLQDYQWISDVRRKNEKINELCDSLSSLAVGLKVKDKSFIYSYLLHSRGQVLFNTILGVVGDLCFETHLLDHEPSTEEKKQLAHRLEKWFTDYKDNFRKSSRESELYRVQEVVFWYADLLRNI